MYTPHMIQPICLGPYVHTTYDSANLPGSAKQCIPGILLLDQAFRKYGFLLLFMLFVVLTTTDADAYRKGSESQNTLWV